MYACDLFSLSFSLFVDERTHDKTREIYNRTPGPHLLKTQGAESNLPLTLDLKDRPSVTERWKSYRLKSEANRAKVHLSLLASKIKNK